MIESYEDIAACVTYMGNVEGSSFRLESYVQIRTCGTYRCRSQPLAAFLDESRVAPHVVGMLLTVAALVIGTRSVNFLLVLLQSTSEGEANRASKKEKSKRERLLRFDLRKKESEGWKNHATSEDNPSPEYWPVKRL